MIKLIFAVLYVSLNDGPYTLLLTAVFYIYICCYSISIHSWDITTSAFRKQTDAIWKFYFRFRLWTFFRASTQQILSELDDHWQSYDVMYIFTDYLHTEFWPDIHSEDITTSGCWNQTSAIFKFYSRFRLWPLHRHRYVTLHWPTKYLRNRSATELWRHIDFTKWRP